MAKIEIKSIQAKYLQVGNHNKMKISGHLQKYDKELLKLIDRHCPSETEKADLLASLKEVELHEGDVQGSANKLYDFVSSIASNLVSSGLMHFLAKTAGIDLS